MSSRLDEPGSPRSLRNKRVCVYSWRQFEKRTHAVLAALAKGGVTQTDLVPLLESPEHVVSLLTGASSEMRFPIIAIDGRLLAFDSAELQEKLPPIADEAMCHVSVPERPEFFHLTPQVEYLDKAWSWPALVFNIIETFGCSVGKSVDDPLLPEEFLIDCLRRNVEVDSPSDCRLLLFELTNCGILEEVKYQEFKLVYHRNLFGLNSNREPFEASVEVPPVEELVNHLLATMARIRRLHSVEYLELVDATHFFRLMRFSDCLKLTERKRKLLVDLHAVMAAQISLLGAIVEAEREKFYFEFADRKIHLSHIREAVLACTPKDQKEAVQCVLELGWTLPGEDEKDAKILEIAQKNLSAQSVISIKTKTYAPSFLKSTRGATTYDIHISPCLSL